MKIAATIRKAKLKDAKPILRLINRYAKDGQMLFRSIEDIRDDIEDFLICEKAGGPRSVRELLGTCSLKYGWDNLVEIRSLAVHPDYYRQGVATALVNECIEEASTAEDMDKIFVLTYTVPLFAKLGFKVIQKSALPLKIWTDCMDCTKRENCDEIAMIRPLRLAKAKVSRKTPARINSVSHPA